MKFRPVFFILVILAGGFLANFVLAAQPGDVVINEIAWMGTADGWQYEWLELYNNTTQSLDIPGFKIENAGEKNKTLEIFAGTIPANGLFLICKRDITNCDFISWSLSLNNNYQENGKLVLRDNLGNLIDETPEAIDKKWPAGDNETKQTMERVNPLSRLNLDNWADSENPGGTPGEKNSIIIEFVTQPPEEIISHEEIIIQSEAVETKTETGSPSISALTTYPSGILINEILPSPDGADELEEWIELKNLNSEEVDLFQWKIEDITGSTHTYIFPGGTKIGANGFLVLARPLTKITLNNTGDGLKLIRPDDTVLNSVTFEKAGLGQSYNRMETGWAWSAILTPGSENVIPSSTPFLSSTPPGSVEISTPPGNVESESEELQNQKSAQSSNNIEADKQLAAVGRQFVKSPKSFYIFLIAFGLAIFSSAVILFLKKKLRRDLE